MLAIKRVGTCMIADQIGERTPLVALGRREIGGALGEGGCHRMGGDRLDDIDLRHRSRGCGVFEVVEAEILGGQAAGGMLDIGNGRGRIRFGSDRRIGDGNRRTTESPRTTPRRGTEIAFKRLTCAVGSRPGR